MALRFLLGLAGLALLASTGGCGGPDSASVTLAEARVTMTVRPMFSLQRDWHRALTVEAGGRRLAIDLPGDTGWWRGSNLYRHESGTLVLHEGQAGCVTFTTAPVAMVPSSGIVCDRGSPSPAAADPGGEKEPRSRFYPGLAYLGRFEEVSGEGGPIRFIGHESAPEAELPDPL